VHVFSDRNKVLGWLPFGKLRALSPRQVMGPVECSKWQRLV